MKRETILLIPMLIAAACSDRSGNQQPSVSANTAVRPNLSHPPDVTGWPIIDRRGKQVGLVATRLNNAGVVVSLDTMGLPPGLHGVHIHQNAKCEGPTFESAGGHWNWTNKKHGHKNPQGYHAGDLGNLTVAADGKGQATFTVAAKDWDPKLSGGLPVLIHAEADDDRTDPSGNSGDRIACGLIYLRRD